MSRYLLALVLLSAFAQGQEPEGECEEEEFRVVCNPQEMRVNVSRSEDPETGESMTEYVLPTGQVCT